MLEAPSKLDWQIYDHCAALTRLYAVYEQYVGDLVGEYVRLLPKLYAKYADLPERVTNQPRIGIGSILLKIGEKGPYRDLEEQVVVRELAAGLGGASEYTLLADAFFIDRQNLRFDMLCKLFRSLGFDHCGNFINKHSAVKDFIKGERADSSTAEKELRDFIEYRNEAAHRKVENVLSIDAIRAIGRFLSALGDALADLVDGGVLRRRMELSQYVIVLSVTEIYKDGYVVIGTPKIGVRLAVGDEVVVFGKRVCYRATLESLQIEDRAVPETTGDGATEVGLRLNRRVPTSLELRRIETPLETPTEIQLPLEDVIPSMTDTAETDLPEVAESESLEGVNEDDEVTASGGIAPAGS